MKRLILLVLVCVTVFFTAEAQSPQREETVIVLGKASYIPYQDEYEKMLYPTVRISTPSGVGSGVVIAVRGERFAVSGKPITDNQPPTTVILTAAHVVANETTVNIELYDSTIITGTVVITDTAKDLALIKPQINTDFTDKIYTARLAPKDYTPYLFAPVWTVGCSLGLKPRPSFGYLCALGDSVADNWEVSSPVLPGNSGGPVYDARTFEVIGIAVWVKVYQYQLVTTMAGVVPIGEIHDFLNSKSEILKPKQIQNPKSKTFGH